MHPVFTASTNLQPGVPSTLMSGMPQMAPLFFVFVVVALTTSFRRRRPTRTVKVGQVPVGSQHPVAVQTMTTSSTDKVEDTLAQLKKTQAMGVDIVRVTVQGMKEAKGVHALRQRMVEEGVTVPLVADIHFTPKVALAVADDVDKVRINPGNFVDGVKTFDKFEGELTDQHIQEWQQKIREKLTPLVMKLKSLGKALRIGVNHGSMAERILLQYGDTPEGMVASAFEFLEICRELDFHDLIFSMKSSNPVVMVQAYRLLAQSLDAKGYDYPIHLGVTEAGSGSDGRIKSSVGIGSLLLDGIGDTIRVSLTEDPWLEISPCRTLAKLAGDAAEWRPSSGYVRRKVDLPLDINLNPVASALLVIKPTDLFGVSPADLFENLGLQRKAGSWEKNPKSVDGLILDFESCFEDPRANSPELEKLLADLKAVGLHIFTLNAENIRRRPMETPLLGAQSLCRDTNVGGSALLLEGHESEAQIQEALAQEPRLIFYRPKAGVARLAHGRRIHEQLMNSSVPFIPWYSYDTQEVEADEVVIGGASDFGALFVDGIGNGCVWQMGAFKDIATLKQLSLNLLQAARMRFSKTEFISCPSCGRTLFDLQDTTKRIQKRTGHLPGVRIAVMGCIVNGPGEMADADFGYVGSLPGKVDLYVGRSCVVRGIPYDEADQALVDLIKEHGMWRDPE